MTRKYHNHTADQPMAVITTKKQNDQTQKTQTMEAALYSEQCIHYCSTAPQMEHSFSCLKFYIEVTSH